MVIITQLVQFGRRDKCERFRCRWKNKIKTNILYITSNGDLCIANKIGCGNTENNMEKSLLLSD